MNNIQYYNFRDEKINTNKCMKKYSLQTLRDKEHLNQRVEKYKDRIEMIDRSLIKSDGKRVTMSELVGIASFISNIIKRKLDRIAYRSRKGLICWIIESCNICTSDESIKMLNFSNLSEFAANNIKNSTKTQKNEIIDRNKDENEQLECFNNDEKATSLKIQLLPSIPNDFHLPPLMNEFIVAQHIIPFFEC